MAKIRGSRKKLSGFVGVEKDGYNTSVYYDRINPHPIRENRKTKKNKKIGALPVGFSGKFYGVPFKIHNQFQLDGTVEAVAEDTNTGATIVVINGKNKDQAAAAFFSYIEKHAEPVYSEYQVQKDLLIIKKDVKKFVDNITKEVNDYNKGNHKTAAPVKVNIGPAPAKKTTVKIPKIKKAKTSIKDTPARHRLILPQGSRASINIRINGPDDIASTVKKLNQIKDAIAFKVFNKKTLPMIQRKKATAEINQLRKNYSTLKKYLQTQINSIK